MPAVSEKQRRFLFATKGPAWVKEHHFDNKGPLPLFAASARKVAQRKAKR